MKLRNYQEKAVEAVLENWKSHRSTLIVLPTGCGKTVVFGEVVRRLLSERKSKVMILAHREELIRQAADKVGKLAGTQPQIEMGEMHVGELFLKDTQVVVSSVQTQNTGRMHNFNPKDFGCLVIDEAHHATSQSYRKCIEHYLANPDCRLLGVTATPDRADEIALGSVFESVAFEYSVTDAINDGWLVPIRQKLVKVSSLDFSKVSTCAGDFNQGELAQLMEEEESLHAVAAPTLEICGNRRAIVFAASVRQADRLAEILTRGGAKAAWICGKTEKKERQETLRRFHDGEIQFVVNVGVLTEGFDDAGVEVVVMARPTKSRALYAQMAGRATRPAAEIAAQLGESEDRRGMIAASSKPSCLIVDFVGNSGRHKLITSADILGGKDPDDDEAEAIRRARKRCEDSGEETDIAAEIEKSREEIKAEKEREAKRRSFILATAKYVEFSVDPFNLYDLPPVETMPKCALGTNLTWRQQELLRDKLKVNPEGIGPAKAKQLLDEYFRRVNAKLASFGQVKYLRSRGIPVPMKFDEASRTINRLIGKRRFGYGFRVA